MNRVILCASLVLAVVFWGGLGTVRAEEKAPKVTKDQLVGAWKHYPGERDAFNLREDGSGGLLSTGPKFGCRWNFDEHYQVLIIVTNQLKRQYKAKIDEGKVVLYEGRDVWFKGANLNNLLVSPLDKAVKVEKEKEAVAP
jgi:hypothetical protein